MKKIAAFTMAVLMLVTMSTTVCFAGEAISEEGVLKMSADSDTYTRQGTGYSDMNYSTDKTLVLTESGVRRAFIRFENVKAFKNASQIKLKVMPVKYYSGADSIIVMGMTGKKDWKIEEMTHNYFSGNGLGKQMQEIGTIARGTENTYLELDVTDYVKSQTDDVAVFYLRSSVSKQVNLNSLEAIDFSTMPVGSGEPILEATVPLYAQNESIQDETGADVAAPVAGTTVTYSATLYNFTADSVLPNAYIAAYDAAGKLLTVGKSLNETEAELGESVDLTAGLVVPENTARLAVMVLDSYFHPLLGITNRVKTAE